MIFLYITAFVNENNKFLYIFFGYSSGKRDIKQTSIKTFFCSKMAQKVYSQIMLPIYNPILQNTNSRNQM